MKIAVVHNQVGTEDGPDARDVLVQAQTISASLSRLGHVVTLHSCSLNLDAVRTEMLAVKPDLVFNLVEDLGGHGRLIHLFASLLDALAIPYTGSAAEVLFLSSHKTMAKEIMARAGLPTPRWIGPWPLASHAGAVSGNYQGPEKKWIIKSLWEHASLGLDGDSIVVADSSEILERRMRKSCTKLGGACFAEEYIEGREFNLSILAQGAEMKILPPAEIVFANYSPEKIRIVDYQAKWQEDSFAYQNTIRRFDFDNDERELLIALTELALRCAQVFGIRGYARVDFRVDSSGNPFILEVNANPCLSPDAGFAAAAGRAGLDFDGVVAGIFAASGSLI